MDLQQRANRLLELVKQEGIDSVAQHTDLEKMDHSLLHLIKDSQIPSTPAEERLAVANYVVRVINYFPQVVDEVALFFKRNSDNPAAPSHFTWMTNVLPGQTRFFNLGACSDLQSYALGAFIGSEAVVTIPPPGTGPMTPARAALQYPQNHVGPCEDRWPLM